MSSFQSLTGIYISSGFQASLCLFCCSLKRLLSSSNQHLLGQLGFVKFGECMVLVPINLSGPCRHAQGNQLNTSLHFNASNAQKGLLTIFYQLCSTGNNYIFFKMLLYFSSGVQFEINIEVPTRSMHDPTLIYCVWTMRKRGQYNIREFERKKKKGVAAESKHCTVLQ